MTRLMSSDELVAHEFPNPAWLVEPMIPLGGITMLHGNPGVGKTQFILTLADAINSGTPLFGRWPVHEGPVVIIQADMTGQIQQARVVKAIQRANLSSTYYAVEEDGSTPVINITTMRLRNRDLVQAIQDLDPALVIWDTLRKIHTLPENASETAVTVFQKAREIAPRATHAFIHHDRKQSRDPEALINPGQDFMGTQQWLGSCDTTLSLKEIGTSPKRVICAFHKTRTAPDHEKRPFALELDPATMLFRPVHPFTPDSPACNSTLHLLSSG